MIWEREQRGEFRDREKGCNYKKGKEFSELEWGRGIENKKRGHFWQDWGFFLWRNCGFYWNGGKVIIMDF